MAIAVGAGDYGEYEPFVAAANYDFILFTFDTPSVAWGYSVADDTWTEIREATDTFEEGDFNYLQNVFKFGSGDVRSIQLDGPPDNIIDSDSSLDSGVTLTHHSVEVEPGGGLVDTTKISPNGDYWVAISDNTVFGTVTTVRFYKSSDKGDTWEEVYEWNAISGETFREFCVTINSLYVFVTPNTPGTFADTLMYYLDLSNVGSGVSLVSGMPVTDGTDQWAPSALLSYPAINVDVMMTEAVHYDNPISSPYPTNHVSLFRIEAGVATDVTDSGFPNSGSPDFDTEFVDFQSWDGVIWLGNSLGDRSGSGNYLLRTDDAGATWTYTQDQGLDPGNTLISIALMEDGTALRTILDDSAFPTLSHKIQKSTDFGVTWTDVTMPATFTALGGYVHHGTPGGGGSSFGPAVIYVSDGIWRGLRASDEVVWEDHGFGPVPGGGFGGVNGYATDTDNIEVISLAQQSVDSDSSSDISTDGAATFVTDTDVGALPGLLNILVFVFRDGLYRVLVFDSNGEFGTTGGEYSSPDGMSPWTRTGRVFPKFFKTSIDPAPLNGDVWPADIWCATEDHAYYVMREDNSFTGLWRSIYADVETEASPVVWRLEHESGDPPTGGTFALSLDAVEYTNPIAFNASAATILTELQALSNWVGTGSSSGSFATHIEITAGENGFKFALAIDQSSLTPGTAEIFSTVETIAQNGLGTFVTDPSVGSPVHQFNRMWGSVTGDVALVFLSVGGVEKLWKIAGATAPTDVTPGFLGAGSFDSIDRLMSPDGVTWIGKYYDSNTDEESLMQSDDSGATWTLVHGPLEVDRITDWVFDPVVADKWYMLEWDVTFVTATLKVSTDGGATWAAHATADTLEFGGRIIPLGGRFN